MHHCPPTHVGNWATCKISLRHIDLIALTPLSAHSDTRYHTGGIGLRWLAAHSFEKLATWIFTTQTYAKTKETTKWENKGHLSSN